MKFTKSSGPKRRRRLGFKGMADILKPAFPAVVNLKSDLQDEYRNDLKGRRLSRRFNK